MNEFRPVDSDFELLRAARTDPDAFAAFYRRHAVAVERWIRAKTPDMATAADLTAETFAQALVSLGRFRGATDESARAWLYGIARNLVRRYHRRGRVELATCQKLGIQLGHDPDELAEIESQIDAAIKTPELTQALNTLPDTQRQALRLRVVDQMDYDQAAALMGTTPAARRSRGRPFRLLAASTTGLAAIATAAVLAVGATTATSPAFAVPRLHDGSVSVKINRTTSIAEVNRKLAAMGIERIGKRALTAGEDLASIPDCSSIPAGWKGEWAQMAGSSSGPGYTISETVAPGTWVLLYCNAGHVGTNLGAAGSGNTGTTG